MDKNKISNMLTKTLININKIANHEWCNCWIRPTSILDTKFLKSILHSNTAISCMKSI